MGRPRNDRCTGCGKPVGRGRCLNCRRTARREHWHDLQPQRGRARTFREKELELQTGIRRCSKCGSWKPFGCFYWRTSRGYDSICKTCFSAMDRIRGARNRALRRAGDEHLRALRNAQKRRARARKAAQKALTAVS